MYGYHSSLNERGGVSTVKGNRAGVFGVRKDIRFQTASEASTEQRSFPIHMGVERKGYKLTSSQQHINEFLQRKIRDINSRLIRTLNRLSGGIFLVVKYLVMIYDLGDGGLAPGLILVQSNEKIYCEKHDEYH